ncbi:MAG: ABC transporter substrate-binding protein [Clostridia bacterium]|nr:ABC transporter substrate-binding protein [Clostridia bacterium]
MKTFFKAVSVFLSLLFILMATGCKKDYKKSYVYFELGEKPSTLDAQTASNDSELLIVRNIYEGLLRKNENGDIVCGVAKDYNKSGLVYTFNLRENADWSNGESLTANDFVYALRRAVSPDTKAPFASRLFCIKNAREVYNGKAELTSLGVSAKNENTLIIELCCEDKDFENTLTTSVCMPCNEKFFKSCVGKYGLKSEYTISNGSYSITKWNKDDFGIRLYKNKEYKGDLGALNSAVFLSCREDEKPLELLKENHTDISFLNGSEIKDAKANGLSVISYQNISWVMTIGKEFSKDVRKALLMSVSPDIYGNPLPDGYSVARSLFPQVLNCNSADGVGILPYDLQTAKNILSTAVNKMENKKFPPATLYYCEGDGIKPIITSIVGHWQNNLSAFINIQPISNPDEMIDQISNSTLQFAVFPVRADNTSLNEYLSKLKVTSNRDTVSVQTQLLKDNTVIPIAFENTNIAHTSAIKQIYSEPQNGYIDFSFVIKEE